MISLIFSKFIYVFTWSVCRDPVRKIFFSLISVTVNKTSNKYYSFNFGFLISEENWNCKNYGFFIIIITHELLVLYGYYLCVYIQVNNCNDNVSKRMRKRRRKRERENMFISSINFSIYLYITGCTRVQNLFFFFQFEGKRVNFERENAISLSIKNGSEIYIDEICIDLKKI